MAQRKKSTSQTDKIGDTGRSKKPEPKRQIKEQQGGGDETDKSKEKGEAGHSSLTLVERGKKTQVLGAGRVHLTLRNGHQKKSGAPQKEKKKREGGEETRPSRKKIQ